MIRARSVCLAFDLVLALLLATHRGFADPPKDGRPVPVPPAASQSTDAIKPRPLPPIPDNPPPHEGAMIDLPYVVEPPDLIIVEVLEALPGRPITGERLVQPEGTISLGFYGSIHVSGLTTTQIKEKIIAHLQRFLPDDTLGLLYYEPSSGPFERTPASSSPPSPAGQTPAKGGDEPADDTRSKTSPKSSSLPRPKTATRTGFVRRTRRQHAAQTKPPEDRKPAETPTPANSETSTPARPAADRDSPAASTLQLPGGHVKITIEVSPTNETPVLPPRVKPSEGEPIPFDRSEDVGEDGPMPDRESERIHPIAPADSDRVFVDVTSYNSKRYYVQGDVASPGSLPATGRETVLDAIIHAGGLLSIADPRQMRLVRPGRGDRPAKVYPIDYEAILEKGDPRANLQVFPGDRLIIGRNAMIKTTSDIDRVATPFQTLVNSMLQASFMVRSLVTATPDLSSAQREALMKDWIGLFWKTAGAQGDKLPDEQTFRDLILRQLQSVPGSTPPGKTPSEPGTK